MSENDKDEEKSGEPNGSDYGGPRVSKTGVLKGEEALALARQGKNVWNAWAAEHESWEVDFENVDFINSVNAEISFQHFCFPGCADFRGATFSGYTNFGDATFNDDADFGDATFSGDAHFYGAKFSGDAHFYNASFSGPTRFGRAKFSVDAHFNGATFDVGANFQLARFSFCADFNGAKFSDHADFAVTTFCGDADFGGGKFEGPFTLHATTFHNVPDLRRTIISTHVTLHGMKVGYETEQRRIWFRQAVDPQAADKFRRLKQLAIDARDHDRELELLAGEYRAKRFHETDGLALILNYLYDWLSDFGRSVWRPAAGLFATWLAMAPAYVALTATSGAWYTKLTDALAFSAGNLLPFLSGSRSALIDTKATLYGKAVPVLVHAVSITEGLLAAVFIFLLGLALRNRFRL